MEHARAELLEIWILDSGGNKGRPAAGVRRRDVCAVAHPGARRVRAARSAAGAPVTPARRGSARWCACPPPNAVRGWLVWAGPGVCGGASARPTKPPAASGILDPGCFQSGRTGYWIHTLSLSAMAPLAVDRHLCRCARTSSPTVCQFSSQYYYPWPSFHLDWRKQPCLAMQDPFSPCIMQSVSPYIVRPTGWTLAGSQQVLTFAASARLLGAG
jgi:hypothetical protein